MQLRLYLLYCTKLQMLTQVELQAPRYPQVRGERRAAEKAHCFHRGVFSVGYCGAVQGGGHGAAARTGAADYRGARVASSRHLSERFGSRCEDAKAEPVAQALEGPGRVERRVRQLQIHTTTAAPQ